MLDVKPGTLRLLQLATGLNVLLAIGMVPLRLLDGAPWPLVASSIGYGLGFAAIFISSTRALRRPGAGRAWMLGGALLLVTASALFFVR